jgi:hypothetical protein
MVKIHQTVRIFAWACVLASPALRASAALAQGWLRRFECLSPAMAQRA